MVIIVIKLRLYVTKKFSENGGSVCSAESAMHQSHTTDNVKNIQYDSLLHQKLSNWKLSQLK